MSEAMAQIPREVRADEGSSGTAKTCLSEASASRASCLAPSPAPTGVIPRRVSRAQPEDDGPDAWDSHRSDLRLPRFPLAAERDPERQGDEPEVEAEAALADVEKVVAELLPPRRLPRQEDLGQAGQPRPDGVARRVAGDRRRARTAVPPPLTSCSFGRRARGPTKLMSPLKMLRSWGSSSMAVARRTRPTRVTRGIAGDGLDRPACRLRVPTMDRNLSALKIRPFRPTRSWA